MAEVGTVIGVVAMVVGLVTAFFGYRIFRVFLYVAGFLIVGSVASVVALAMSGESGFPVLAFLMGGLLGGSLTIEMYLFGIFITGAAAGVLPAVAVPLASGSEPSWTIAAVLGLVAGIIALSIEKFLIIVSTSATGALLAVLGFLAARGGFYVDRFDVEEISWQVDSFVRAGLGTGYSGSFSWLALVVAGVIVQYRSLPDVQRASTMSEASGEAIETHREIEAPRLATAASGAADSSGVDGVEPAARPADVAAAAPSQVTAPPGDGELRDLVVSVRQARADVAHIHEQVQQRVAAEREADEREVSEALQRRRREVRDAFRTTLDALRNEVHDATRAAGPSTDPWCSETWGALRPEAATASQDIGPVRIGGLKLFASSAREDVLTVPAMLDPAAVGVCIVAHKGDDSGLVQGAFAGWCARAIAMEGPERVSIAWFGGDEASDVVPDEWRADARGGAAGIEAWLRLLGARSGTAPQADADDSEAAEGGHRCIVVALDGPAADAASAKLVRAASDAMRSRTHLLLATRRPLDVEHAGVVQLRTVDDGASGTFRCDPLASSPHELVLQTAPPAEVLARMANWSHSTPSLTDMATIAFEPSTGATDTHQPPPTDDAGTADDRDRSVKDGAVSRFRDLLRAPARFPPLVTLGVEEHGRPLDGAHPGRVTFVGGSVREATAQLTSRIMEMACQVDADSLEFVVVDLGDDVAVADRFDVLPDAVPHLVDVADGATAYVALDDLHRRVAAGEVAGGLCLTVILGTDHGLPETITRVLRAASEAHVPTFVWVPRETGFEASLDASEARVDLDGGRWSVRWSESAARELAPAPTLTSDEIRALGRELREARS